MHLPSIRFSTSFGLRDFGPHHKNTERRKSKAVVRVPNNQKGASIRRMRCLIWLLLSDIPSLGCDCSWIVRQLEGVRFGSGKTKLNMVVKVCGLGSSVVYIVRALTRRPLVRSPFEPTHFFLAWFSRLYRVSMNLFGNLTLPNFFLFVFEHFAGLLSRWYTSKCVANFPCNHKYY